MAPFSPRVNEDPWEEERMLKTAVPEADEHQSGDEAGEMVSDGEEAELVEDVNMVDDDDWEMHDEEVDGEDAGPDRTAAMYGELDHLRPMPVALQMKAMQAGDAPRIDLCTNCRGVLGGSGDLCSPGKGLKIPSSSLKPEHDPALINASKWKKQCLDLNGFFEDFKVLTKRNIREEQLEMVDTSKTQLNELMQGDHAHLLSAMKPVEKAMETLWGIQKKQQEERSRVHQDLGALHATLPASPSVAHLERIPRGASIT
eukprot:gene31755-40032_t